MRRALPLVVAIAVIAVTAWFAVTLPAPGAGVTGEPRITRLFIPAIKLECREHAGIPASADIGYTFTGQGALTTIDRDGSFTGIEPDRLVELNACLAQYPIEPITDMPHDHYSRNLLYDYNVEVLEPCLAGRVDGLPPMPSRSDFVVRLYAWDPFRTLARDHPLPELLSLSSACPQVPGFLAVG